jgi:hypothetical protein
MPLLTDDVRAALPPLYSQENNSDPIVPVKFFTPDGQWTWYATECDGSDICFGLVNGFEEELGYFSLVELSAVRGMLGLPVERDLYWKPKPLSHCYRGYRAPVAVS